MDCASIRKVEACCSFNAMEPHGHPIECKSSLIRLGSLQDESGHIGPELNRRRLWQSQFSSSQSSWEAYSHQSPSQGSRILDACTASQLLLSTYSLAWLTSIPSKTGWLSGSMFAETLITGIPHYYLSRVSNMEVLKEAVSKPHSQVFTHKQLRLIVKIVALPSSDAMRTCVSEEGSFRLCSGMAKIQLIVQTPILISACDAVVSVGCSSPLEVMPPLSDCIDCTRCRHAKQKQLRCLFPRNRRKQV